MPSIQADGLWRQASARWAEIGAKRPDLAAAIDLQRSLLRLQIDALIDIDAETATGSDPFARGNGDIGLEEAVPLKWQRGLPAFRNDPVFIPRSLGNVLPRICSIIAEGGAGEHAVELRDALVAGRIDPDSVLKVSFARNEKAMRTSALHLGFSPDLIWLVGELGSSPLAYVLQRRLMTLKALDNRSSDWNRGYCLCCGSWPVLIELQNGARVLRCSFCAASWQLAGRRCVYCGNAGNNLLSAAPDGQNPGRRLELCGACANYTKVIAVETPTPFPLLAIEDLATMDLDEGAMQRGYSRPDLADLDSIEPLASPDCA